MTVKTEPSPKEPEQMEDKPAPAPITAVVTTSSSSRRNSRVEEADRKSEPTQPTPQSTGMVTTKSGRASKPSTPALPSFSDAAAAAARPRTTRNIEPAGNGKKSQKKGSIQALAQLVVDEDGNSSMQGDDGDDDADIDPDEATYCYCNSISYGAMVACDSDDCAREWFHLACVGLKVAPSSKSKSTKLSLPLVGDEKGRNELSRLLLFHLVVSRNNANVLGSQMVLPRLQRAPQNGQQKERQPMNQEEICHRCFRGCLAVFEKGKRHHYSLSASYCLSLVLSLLLGVYFLLLSLCITFFFFLSPLFFLN